MIYSLAYCAGTVSEGAGGSEERRSGLKEGRRQLGRLLSMSDVAYEPLEREAMFVGDPKSL